MERLKTLRARFAIWVAGLLLAGMAVFGVFVYSSLARELSSALDDSLRLSASQAISAVNIENGQVNFSDSIPAGSAAADLVEHGLTIRILSLHGADVQAFGPYRDVPLDTAALASAIANRSSFGTFTDPQEGDRVRIYTSPIVEDNQMVGIIQVAQDMGNIQDTLSLLLVALLLAIPLLVGGAGLGGYFLAARALAPIDAMTHTARRISAEDLSARLNLPATDDEVGRLATTFDDMLGRLDEAFRHQRQFTADASHELRTPLAGMQTILSVIRQGRRTIEDYEQALIDLTEETNRLQVLTEDLLLLARGDIQQIAVRKTVNLTDLLRDVSDSMLSVAEEKGLFLTCNVPDNLTLTGDGDELIRLFVNLLDNAIKFTKDGGVTISAARDINEVIHVSVSDTGPGIPPDDLPHIFDRFYRAERARATHGFGLGLSIANSIASMHLGSIKATSAIGKGTTFTVSLPIG
jgi:heavy metal sensor kinase